MNNSLTVSVVIPCYNSENTIEKCVNSVFNQSHLPNEIIVIDDGSLDKTLDLLKRIEIQKPNEIDFFIITQRNSGPSVARNKGILRAKGKWIAFLDSDDYWDEFKIEHQLNEVRKDSDIVILSSSNQFPKEDAKQITFNMLLVKNYFQTSSVLVKSKVMKDFLFKETQKYSEDYRSWLQIVSEYKAVVIYPAHAFQIFAKRAFGESGLSSKLWEMQKGELSNFWLLAKQKKISYISFFKFSTFSFLKFLRRIIISKKI